MNVTSSLAADLINKGQAVILEENKSNGQVQTGELYKKKYNKGMYHCQADLREKITDECQRIT